MTCCGKYPTRWTQSCVLAHYTQDATASDALSVCAGRVETSFKYRHTQCAKKMRNVNPLGKFQQARVIKSARSERLIYRAGIGPALSPILLCCKERYSTPHVCSNVTPAVRFRRVPRDFGGANYWGCVARRIKAACCAPGKASGADSHGVTI